MNFVGHYCLIFERLGVSLYDLVKKNDYKPLPFPCIVILARQLLEALQFLKSINLIHTDLKMENVLFVEDSLERTTVDYKGKKYHIEVPRKFQIKLIDFGGATYDDDRSKSTTVNTRQYRGPEVILELGWSFPSDVWSIGCIVAEAFSGDLLFQTHGEMEHLALMEKCVGSFPSSMLRRSKHESTYFDRDGWVKRELLTKSSQQFVKDMPRLEDFCISLYGGNEQFSQLMQALLTLDPHKRATAEEALQFELFSGEKVIELPNHN